MSEDNNEILSPELINCEEYDAASKEYWRAERAKELFKDKLRNIEQYLKIRQDDDMTKQFFETYCKKQLVEKEIERLRLVGEVFLEEMKRLKPSLSSLGSDCTVFDQT